MHTPDDFAQGLPEPAEKGWRDVPFLILFVIHLAVVGVLTGLGWSKRSDFENMGPPDPNNPQNIFDRLEIGATDVRNVAFAVLAATVVGCLSAVLWLMCCKYWPRKMIVGTLVASVLMWLAFGAFMLYQRQFWGGIISLIMCLIMAGVWYMWRHRIPFAAQVLATCVRVLNKFMGMALMSFVCMVLQLGWVLVWGISLVSAAFLVSEGATYVMWVFLMFSFYWTSQVIRNTAHVTISGVYATWYFMGGDNQALPRNPTLGSAKRALTTSFGSICLGSLLVALIQTLRAVLRSMRSRSNAILVCIVDCLLGCIESLVRLFNRYAFTQVAIFGKSFCEAAKSTWHLVHSHGVSAIMNDSLLSGVMSIGCLITAALCFGVGYGVGLSFFPPPACFLMMDGTTSCPLSGGALFCGVVSAITGYSIMMMAMMVIDSGVATIFVCFAMDPDALRMNDPDLHQAFFSTYHGQLNFGNQPSAGRV